MMQNLFKFLGLFVFLTSGSYLYAGDIQVEGAWLRATAPGQDSASVDMSITSTQTAILTGVSSEVCRVAELHRMTQEGGMMKMRQVKELELPAGRQVNLGKIGYHLMLIGLKAPLKEGDIVPLTLSIRVGNQGAVKLKTNAEVRSLTAMHSPSHDDEHMQMKMN